MLLTCGINHKTAPIEVRELLAFDQEQTSVALRKLAEHPAINEAVILSTCNRTEIYSDASAAEPLLNWLMSHQKAAANTTDYHYYYYGIDSVRHLMRVASGLDSMVIGEPQILGQIKAAYRLACDIGCVGQQLRHLFPAVFAVSKQIRSTTAIGNNPVSMAYIVVDMAKRIFADLEQCRALLIGAGEMINLAAAHLTDAGVRQLSIANRTVEKSQQLADMYHAEALRIGDIPEKLPHVDIIITATASQLPILGKGTMESVLHHKKRNPMFIADLGMPRDVEPEINQLDDIYLYNIDDLQEMINKNMKNRLAAARQAEKMVEIQANHYMRQLRVLDVSDMICRYRQRIAHLRDRELTKTLARLQQGDAPEKLLQQLAYNLTNKIMHQPTVAMRQAAYNDKLDMLITAQELLDI